QLLCACKLLHKEDCGAKGTRSITSMQAFPDKIPDGCTSRAGTNAPGLRLSPDDPVPGNRHRAPAGTHARVDARLRCETGPAPFGAGPRELPGRSTVSRRRT